MSLHSPARPTRRQVLAATAATGLTATAGCLGDGIADPDASLSATHTVTVPPDGDPARSKWFLSPAELAVYVERQRERFGDAAPWSLTAPGRHEGEFVGAWASSPTVTGGGSKPLARLDLLCVTRRVGDDEPRLRHVLWAGGSRETTRKPVVGSLGPTLALASVGVGLTTADEPVDFLTAAPETVAAATDDGTLTVHTRGATRLTQPIPAGELTIERESGDDGTSYLLRWRGNRPTPTALTAICETTTTGAEEELGFGVRGNLGVAGRGPL